MLNIPLETKVNQQKRKAMNNTKQRILLNQVGQLINFQLTFSPAYNVILNMTYMSTESKLKFHHHKKSPLDEITLLALLN